MNYTSITPAMNYDTARADQKTAELVLDAEEILTDYFQSSDKLPVQRTVSPTK